MQTTSKVLMVRPVRFGFNEQTAGNNSFQKRGYELSAQDMALEEFDNFVSLLRANNVEVVVVEDTPEPHTPDSIFPNNWFSTHASGELVLYPMCAPNRRLERKESVLNVIKEIGERG
ncbi:MAG: amidinotransferase, partial [Bacteroidales bacterium]|nr:amidinotransferase [Bacteroidales bacterium]